MAQTLSQKIQESAPGPNPQTASRKLAQALGQGAQLVVESLGDGRLSISLGEGQSPILVRVEGFSTPASAE